jgi:hypothetical protein
MDEIELAKRITASLTPKTAQQLEDMERERQIFIEDYGVYDFGFDAYAVNRHVDINEFRTFFGGDARIVSITQMDISEL